jgi:hypothetical protein
MKHAIIKRQKPNVAFLGASLRRVRHVSEKGVTQAVMNGAAQREVLVRNVQQH